MTDLYGPRRERFVYRRVEFPGYAEREDLGNFTGGSVDLSAFTDLKASGTASFVGEAPPPSDLVRVIYRMTDDRGLTEDFPIATMFAYCDEPSFDGSKWSGDLDMRSVLSVLASKVPGTPDTVPAGTDVVEMAAGIARDEGLRVDNAVSAYRLASDHTFDPSESLLTRVNWLLGAAGFSSCSPDAWGTVRMQPYVEPTGRTPVRVFRDDEHSIMLPQASRRREWGDAVNAVRLSYSTADEELSAWALDVDPDSETSTARTFERTLHETVDELAGETAEERLANLAAMAEKRLADNLAKVERVSIRHAYVPMSPDDAVGVEYVSAVLSWGGAVTDMRMQLKTPFLADTEARTFVRADFKIEKGGEIVYGTTA